MGIETIVEKLCENLYEEKEERKEEILKEVEEDIKKEIKYEDTEKVLPGDIKVIERKINKFPIPIHYDKDYNNLITKLVEEKIGERLKEKIKKQMEGKKDWEDYYRMSLNIDIRRIEYELSYLAFRYITNGRFPSFYTAAHIYNGYLNGTSSKTKEYKVRTAFDEVLNDKIRFPIWVSFTDTFYSERERIFIFGKRNPVFKKALKKTAKFLESRGFTLQELCNRTISYSAKKLRRDWKSLLDHSHLHSVEYLDLLYKKENVEKVALVEDIYHRMIGIREPTSLEKEGLGWFAIAALMHYEIPMFICPTNGIKIEILGDIKFKDAEMYVDMKGYTRDKYKILSEGPKVIFFYDPYKEESAEKE
jgi:hypothetical protein